MLLVKESKAVKKLALFALQTVNVQMLGVTNPAIVAKRITRDAGQPALNTATIILMMNVGGKAVVIK